MSRILIVFNSKHGQTLKIANFLADTMAREGHSYDLFDAKVNHDVSPSDYDAILIGAPIYRSRFPESIIEWIQENAEALGHSHAAFFGVSLGILQQSPPVQEDELRIMRDFFARCHWHPSQWTLFAGGLAYSKYNWFTKIIMRFIAKRAGVQTTWSQDYEYTNWDDVHQFAMKFLEPLQPRPNKSMEAF